MKIKIYKIFINIFLNLVFLLHIRIPYVLLIRKLRKENKRASIPNYLTPGNIELLVSKFQYTKDPLNGNLDYMSHPEYVQAVIEDPNIKDGDCDDWHWFAANALKKCTDVTNVYYLSVGYRSTKTNKISGHAVCVFRYLNSWYLFDWKIYPINNPNEAPLEVAKRYTNDDNADIIYHVWEGVGENGNDRSGWKPLAINKPLKYP